MSQRELGGRVAARCRHRSKVQSACMLGCVASDSTLKTGGGLVRSLSVPQFRSALIPFQTGTFVALGTATVHEIARRAQSRVHVILLGRSPKTAKGARVVCCF